MKTKFSIKNGIVRKTERTHVGQSVVEESFASKIPSLIATLETFETAVHMGACQIRHKDFETLCFCRSNGMWFMDMDTVMEDSGRNYKMTRTLIVNKFGKSHLIKLVKAESRDTKFLISEKAAVFLSKLMAPSDPKRARWIISSLCRAEGFDFDLPQELLDRVEEKHDKDYGVVERTKRKFFRKLNKIKDYVLPQTETA